MVFRPEGSFLSAQAVRPGELSPKHHPGPEGAVRFVSIARREVTVNDPFRVGESGYRTLTQGYAGWRRLRPGLVERAGKGEARG
jgi:hypothetical protein